MTESASLYYLAKGLALAPAYTLNFFLKNTPNSFHVLYNDKSIEDTGLTSKVKLMWEKTEIHSIETSSFLNSQILHLILKSKPSFSLMCEQIRNSAADHKQMQDIIQFSTSRTGGSRVYFWNKTIENITTRIEYVE